MATIKDMDIHMVKTTMGNILMAGMDIPIKNTVIIILKAKAKVEVKVKKSYP
jgi:hypothetical protein